MDFQFYGALRCVASPSLLTRRPPSIPQGRQSRFTATQTAASRLLLTMTLQAMSQQRGSCSARPTSHKPCTKSLLPRNPRMAARFLSIAPRSLAPLRTGTYPLSCRYEIHLTRSTVRAPLRLPLTRPPTPTSSSTMATGQKRRTPTGRSRARSTPRHSTRPMTHPRRLHLPSRDPQ